VEVKDEEFRLLVARLGRDLSSESGDADVYGRWDGGTSVTAGRNSAPSVTCVSDELLITAQGSIDVDIISDTATGVIVDHAGWPILEGGCGNGGPRGQGCLPWEFGVSSHVGQTAYTFVSPTWPIL